LGECGVVDQQTGGFDAGFHICEFEACALKGSNGLTERLTLTRVLTRSFVGGFGDSEGLCGNTNATCIEHGHGDLEAFALFAEAILSRDSAIFEEQLTGSRCANAKLWFLFSASASRCFSIHEKSSD